MIPEYDRESNEMLDKRIYHDSVNVTSKLIGDLLVAFHWLPTINDEMLDHFRKWTKKKVNCDEKKHIYDDEDNNNIPDLIFMGLKYWT